MKFLHDLLLPIILLIAAYFASENINRLDQALLAALYYAPYALITLSAVACLKFSRGRIFYYLPVLGLSFWAHDHYLLNSQLDFTAQVIQYALYYLLPINALIFYFLKERGIYSIHSAIRIALILAQLGLVAWIITTKQTDLLDLAAKDIIQAYFPTIQKLPATIVLILIAGLILISLKNAFFNRSPIDVGFLGAYIAIIFALYSIHNAYGFMIYISTAVLILSISIIQDSYHMAYRDELTGLMGRRALNEYIMGLGRVYTIAMLDVDNFKKFNDTYGHDVGDQVLKMVGKQMMEITGGGNPFRYGGEEFTIVFPGKRLEKTTPHLEALRESIAAYKLQIRSQSRPKKNKDGKKLRAQKKGIKTVSVTISIGVSQKSDQAKNPESVIKLADKALYRAKKKGRNCLSK